MGKRPLGTLRIIGGEFRSRLLEFDPGEAPNERVRPTPDRVRQTLFDWLTPIIEGARVLDLFAGSGALGLEALSRGAAHVTFVESGKAQCEAIGKALRILKAEDRAEVRNEDALAFLATPLTPALSPQAGRGSYDIALLDPPFDSELVGLALPRLKSLLKPSHRIYVEWHRKDALPWPAGCTVLKEKKAGQVSYALAQFTG